MATSTPACGTDIEELERLSTQMDLPMRFHPTPCHQCVGRVSERQKGRGRDLQIAQWKYIHWNIQGELPCSFCLFIDPLTSQPQNDLENGNGTFIWTDGYKYTVSQKMPPISSRGAGLMAKRLVMGNTFTRMETATKAR